MKSAFIEFKNVSKSYSNEGLGVKNIDLQIQKSEIWVILGESGSGKSTLLKLLYGLMSPDTGEIYCDQKKVLGPEEKLIPGHPLMKMVTQDFELNTFATVYDNIASQLSNTNLEEKKLKTEAIIKMFHLGHLAKHKIKILSGGEQQRVALAKAMITQPAILLLDEPFSQVDTLLKRQLREDIEQLKKYFNTTIIMVSHDPEDAYYMADKVAILRNGKIQQQGTLSEIKNQPKNTYIAELFSLANVMEVNNYWITQFPKLKKFNYWAFYPEGTRIHKKTGIKAQIIGIKILNYHTQIQIQFEDTSKAYLFTTNTLWEPNQVIFIEIQQFFCF